MQHSDRQQHARTRALLNQFARATKAPSDHLKFCRDSEDIGRWYILVHSLAGNDDEFVGAEILFRLDAPDNFPNAPPKLAALTANGVYEPGGSICISVGEYHSNNYLAALGMEGFAQQIVSGLVGWKSLGTGIRLCQTTAAEKARLSRASRAYNLKHNSAIVKMLNEQYATYSARFPAAPGVGGQGAGAPATGGTETAKQAASAGSAPTAGITAPTPPVKRGLLRF